MLKIFRYIFFIFSFFVEINVEAEPFTKVSVEKSLVAEVLQKVSFTDFEAIVETWQENWANANGDKPMNIIELNVTPDQKRFNAVVSWGDAAEGGVNKRVSGKIQKFIMIPVLATPISQQAPINEENLSYVRFSEDQVNQGTALRKEDIIGKTLRAGRSLQLNKPLQFSDLEVPIIIRKGEEVRLRYVDPYFEVSILAIAKSNGGVGQKISFEVGAEKKKTIQATVLNSGQAEIRV
ncbi:MAG: flagellar basal body P-ring formation chaperone FlgA [Pseudomonadota bacterium]